MEAEITWEPWEQDSVTGAITRYGKRADGRNAWAQLSLEDYLRDHEDAVKYRRYQKEHDDIHYAAELLRRYGVVGVADGS